MDPTYSWNIQLAHTPFPKKINTPSTTLRFIGFVAKISVLNPKLPADGQCPKETKESVTFFICSPLIDRTIEFFLYLYQFEPFFIDFLLILLFLIKFWPINKKYLIGSDPSLTSIVKYLFYLYLFVAAFAKSKKKISFTLIVLRMRKMKASVSANSALSNQPFPRVLSHHVV